MEQKGEQNVILVVEKEELKRKVEKRLDRGQDFLTVEINNNDENSAWWDNFIDWDMYNLELIRQAFDKPNNSYAEDYKRNTSSGGIFISGTTKEPSFQETVDSTRGEMRYQVRKLRWFYNNIDLLKCDIKDVKSDNQKLKFHQLLKLLSRFHKIAQELRGRREERDTIIIKDEYDVQDLLNALLHINFDDIRKEEYSPSNSGANSRLDFVLKKEKIIIEVKMSSEKLAGKQLGAELLIDIGRYKEYPDCSDFVIFIYDKGDFIRNKNGLISDLQKQSTNEFTITVIINPE